MDQQLKAGTVIHREFVVDRQRTVDFLGEDLRIYATPELVRDVEQTCLEFLLSHVGDGESSVGTAIALKHVGATLLGHAVRIAAHVKSVEGRVVQFDFTVHEGAMEVASGTHSRFVVNVGRLREKVHALGEGSASGCTAGDDLSVH